MGRHRSPDSELKCLCGTCRACQMRAYYRRKVDAGKPAPRKRVKAFGLYEVDWHSGGHAHSQARFQAFCARRRAVWAAQVARVLAP
jgi:hypothetical protein